MDKFLKIDNNTLGIYFIKELLTKNPSAILWNHKGSFGWIPVEIVKNEIQNAKNNNTEIITFTWQQAYPLRQDVGKILEEMGNEK